MAWPINTGAVASTGTPRAAEIAVGDWARRATAAASTAVAVADVFTATLLPRGRSGMVRIAATVILPAATRSATKHAGSWQLVLV